MAELDDICILSRRVDGPKHSWRFDGDDPYVVCVYCDECRDAHTGRVIRPGRTPDPCTCRPGTDGCPREAECFDWWQRDPEGFKSAYSGRAV